MLRFCKSPKAFSRIINPLGSGRRWKDFLSSIATSSDKYLKPCVSNASERVVFPEPETAGKSIPSPWKERAAEWNAIYGGSLGISVLMMNHSRKGMISIGLWVWKNVLSVNCNVNSEVFLPLSSLCK